MNKFIITLLTIACFSFVGNAQNNRPVTDLPDISVVGKLLTTMAESESPSFDVDEIEFVFQHYLAPHHQPNAAPGQSPLLPLSPEGKKGKSLFSLSLFQ